MGVPVKGTYEEIINSDYKKYGGSNIYNGLKMFTEDIKMHGHKQSIQLVLSPLSITILKLEKEPKPVKNTASKSKTKPVKKTTSKK
jgi:1,4-alpha-glucan branching enzyme